jgi:hypothetical protein
MNISGYLLGAILIGKWLIRRQTGYRPARWGRPAEAEAAGLFQLQINQRDPLTLGLAVLTLLVLGYILTSILNARATFIEAERRFIYRNCLNWLPHSYDSSSTWESFWMYAGLACFFWALRDWLLGKGGSEHRRRRRSDEGSSRSAVRSIHPPDTGLAEQQPSADGRREESATKLPYRLRLLLWVLCINGALLALEAILQRLSETSKLLWLVTPRFNTTPDAQFGPYAYRANAASYFNLLWPVTLGFWLALRQSARATARAGVRIGGGSYLVLLPGAVLMAACPIVSTTRGGTLIAVGNVVIMMALLLWSTRKESFWFRTGACSLFAIIVLLSTVLGLKDLVPRFKTIFTDQMSKRTEIYENAVKIARDFPVLGTGAGTFGSLYQLYRSDPEQDWAAYVHDDWLETRITFGWVGFSLILGMLGIVAARWFRGPGLTVEWEFIATLWLAMAGCLLHAKFDFPFQIYSILFLFLLLAAVLFCSARPHSTA